MKAPNREAPEAVRFLGLAAILTQHCVKLRGEGMHMMLPRENLNLQRLHEVFALLLYALLELPFTSARVMP